MLAIEILIVFTLKKIDASPGFIKITMSHESPGFTVPLGLPDLTAGGGVSSSFCQTLAPKCTSRWRSVYP